MEDFPPYFSKLYSLEELVKLGGGAGHGVHTTELFTK